MMQRIAEVLYKNSIAGTLAETASGGTRFTYHSTWTKSIACCLPIEKREHQWDKGLHPFFQHLGPEGWLREQQARVAHIIEDDDFGLLLRYGADCIGAVSIQPKEHIQVEITEAPTNPGRTVSGVQKKLLVIREGNTFQPAPALGLAPYIAKFNSPGIPTLVRNESLSLRWLTSILGKDEVTAFTLSSLTQGMALVVTRFDRRPTGEKLRLEDCAQILSKPKGRDYSGKYDASYEDIASIISRYSVRPVIDLERFYKRLIAFALIGNCDGHLKNFSLLETSEGLRLSPAYDVVNTAIYPEYDQKLALSICGRKISLDEINRGVFLNFGKEIGLSNKTIEQVFIDLRRQIHKSAPIIHPPVAEDPDGFVTRFEEIVRNACIRILEE